MLHGCGFERELADPRRAPMHLERRLLRKFLRSRLGQEVRLRIISRAYWKRLVVSIDCDRVTVAQDILRDYTRKYEWIEIYVYPNGLSSGP